MSGRVVLRVMSLCFLIFFPSCFHIPFDREFTGTRTFSQEAAGFDLIRKPVEDLDHEEEVLDAEFSQALSREEAVRIALSNNPDLQALFLNIGISKADLVQAGLLTNPELDFLYTVQEDIGAPIVSFVRFQLSDWWIIPFETKVAYSELRITMARVQQRILEVKRDTELAYNECMFAHAVAIVAKEFVAALRKLRDQISEDDNAEEVDLAIVNVILGSELNRRDKFEAEHGVACTELRNVMGMKVTTERVHTTEKLFDYEPILPDIQKILEMAVDLHPQVEIAVHEVELAKHGLSLQRASVFDNVQFGLFTERTELSINNLGPAIKASVPIFDFKQAQIEKAKYLIDKANKTLLNTYRDVRTRIISNYFLLEGYMKILDNFEKIIHPAYESGIKYIMENAEKYAEDEDLDLVVLFQMLDRLYETKIAFLDAKRTLLNTQVRLEFHVGRRLIEYGGGMIPSDSPLKI